MNDALYIAATGMRAQTSQLDAIANNVANVNTPAFKRSQVRFGDLIGSIPGAQSHGADTPEAAGVMLSAVQRSFSPGDLRRIDDVMSIAIQGDGFLEVQLPDGTSAYMRSARLEVNSDRLLSAAGGSVLRQRIHVPQDIRSLTLAEDGHITGKDDAGRATPLGRLDVSLFTNPAGLAPMGDGLWRPSQASGEALSAAFGEASSARLKQGFQEGSNVQLIDEMVQLMVAQRAYEMNAKVLQTADEIAGMTNNLRK